MATTLPLLIPPMAILILLLNPTGTGCNAVVASPSKPLINGTASKWCHGRSEKCVVGEQNADSEFLMDTESSRMLLDFQSFKTDGTKNPEKPAVPDCDRPPRYDGCLGEKRSTPPPDNCGTYNRVNPGCVSS